MIISFKKPQIPNPPCFFLRSFLSLVFAVCPASVAIDVAMDSFTDHPSHHHLAGVTPPSSNPTSSLSQTNPSPNVSPKHIILVISHQQNLDLDLTLQIFNHAGKFHPNFAHTYDTYFFTIKLSIALNSLNLAFSSFFKSQFYFILFFHCRNLNERKDYKCLSFHFWIFVS